MEGILLTIAAAYFFYQSYWSMCFLLWIVPMFLKNKRIELCEKRKTRLCLQFKEAILAIAVNMQAGYSVENAISQSLEDMKQLYEDKNYIAVELFFLVQSVGNNVPLETAFLEVSERSGIRDIKDFAEVLAIGKRSGGDLTEIILNTVNLISEKIEVTKEIDTMISSKKLESKIMNIIPFLIICYISITSPGFFAPLYHNFVGNLIMSICLLLYLFSISLGKRIMKIEV